MTKSQSAIQEEILIHLRELAKTKRFRADRTLAASLDSLTAWSEKLKSCPLPEKAMEVQHIILLCCVDAREFIDWLDTRCVLNDVDGITAYTVRYHRLAEVVLAAAREAMLILHESGERELVASTEKYCRSIEFRRKLANKVAEGLGSAEELLEEDLAAHRGMVRDAAPSPRVRNIAELKLKSVNMEEGVSLFFLWKGTRLLRHKLLFAAVELSHEAGPWLESVADHQRIIWNTLELTEEFFQHCRAETLHPWVETAQLLLEEAKRTTQILTRIQALQDHRRSTLMADVGAVKQALENLARDYMDCHHDLEYVEQRLAKAVGTHLGAWQTLWARCSVTVDDLLGMHSGGSPDTAELMKLLDAAILVEWNDPRLDCVEAIALKLFRRLAHTSVTSACDYLEQTFEMVAAPGMLLDQVTQMFCGVLLRLAEENPATFPGWQRWLNLARGIANVSLATNYTLSSRVATCASVFAIGILVAPGNSLAAQLIRAAIQDSVDDLKKLLESEEDGERLDWFMPQLKSALDDFANREGAIQCALFQQDTSPRTSELHSKPSVSAAAFASNVDFR